MRDSRQSIIQIIWDRGAQFSSQQTTVEANGSEAEEILSNGS